MDFLTGKCSPDGHSLLSEIKKAGPDYKVKVRDNVRYLRQQERRLRDEGKIPRGGRRGR